MKRTVLYIFLGLAIPALCHGSTGLKANLEYTEASPAVWDAYHLELGHEWKAAAFSAGSVDLAPVPVRGSMSGPSLNAIPCGIPFDNRPAPEDMVSMMSFIWAEIFGGVDIVAEVKDFARKIKHKDRRAAASRVRERDSRKRWRIVLACRIDEQTEVAASFKARGQLFRGSDMALEINALDPMSEEIGLRMAYSGGDLDIRADRMTLTETAEARLVVKF